MQKNRITLPVCSLLLCLMASCTEKYPFDEFRKTGGNRYIRLSDGLTNYELSGDPSGSHTVVLIHGGTIPLCIWESQMEALRNAGFKVLRYDQYGKGFSARCKTTYSRDLYLRQLAELLDSLHITSPVSLIGPSFGGAVAINFTARFPQRVRSVILVSPVLNLLNSQSPLVKPMKLLKKPLIGDLIYTLFVRAKIVARGRALIPGGKKSPCATIFARQFTCKGTRHALLSQIRSDAYGDYRDLTRSAGKTGIPILLLRGSNDAEVTEPMLAEIRADLPNCTFMEIANSGHGAATEVPEVFNRIAIDFLNTH
jgi:pimeloyl-ACP methyl ester carboxylesterase